MTKEEKKDELKNRISMALKDPILQQGFEIICKNLTDLENKIADIKANCDLAIEGRDIKIKELEKENAELKEKREQDCDSSWYEGFNCSEKERLKQLTKAKELLELFVQWNYGCCEIPDYKDIVKQAEQFIKEIEK